MVQRIGETEVRTVVEGLASVRKETRLAAAARILQIGFREPRVRSQARDPRAGRFDFDTSPEAQASELLTMTG